ncbi:hypothetical protein OSB04_025661 [Centaurea solstitialis]|uniref:Peptidase A1 domain-containing protein n=1 Tax=Centaurea solstitialis TaxID=347529 RepID=A0AA38SNH6_9ASTR|nr:hypothetical protein OSB04_025661 [Centaurea solstitialis]
MSSDVAGGSSRRSPEREAEVAGRRTSPEVAAAGRRTLPEREAEVVGRRTSPEVAVAEWKHKEKRTSLRREVDVAMTSDTKDEGSRSKKMRATGEGAVATAIRKENGLMRSDKKKGTLEVVHKHGPCSTFSKDKVKSLSVEEILTLDQNKVKSIRSRLTINTQASKATFPAKPERTGLGNYVVRVGLGTPKKDLSLLFDTGSHITWTQCQPCLYLCYSQQEPFFQPSSSTTYSNVSCTAPECSALNNATQLRHGCDSSSTCKYNMIYFADVTASFGLFGKDKLTLTSKDDVINDFYFGCGHSNQGQFGVAAGVLGLGPDKLSFVSQSANKYGKVFSYCLPSRASNTGYLTFGKDGVASDNVAYTPFSNSKGSTLYELKLEAIFVGGKKLAISPTVFSSAGMAIASRIVFTKLPPTAYAALRQAFRAEMTNYTLAKPLDKLDTCYDFSNTTTFTVPGISMLFGGNTKVDISSHGILVEKKKQSCLAFVANEKKSDFGIFGSFQQKTLKVVYDIPAGKVGFAYRGCA